MRRGIPVWLVMSVIVLLVGLVLSRLPGELMGVPDRQTHLPGGTAVLYPQEATARLACAGDPVVFADSKARRYLHPGQPGYGAWGKTTLPTHGFGCQTDLDADGFRAN